MSSNKHISAIAVGVLATSLLGASATAQNALETQPTTISDGVETVASASIQSANPTNRDYHDILSTFKSGDSDQYKFSGCGGVI